jgi:flagellar hook-length control protein FliK
VSGVASEAGAVRHTAHLSQAQRSNVGSPDPGDHTSAFVTLLLDDTPTVQKFAPKPQNNASPRSSAPTNMADSSSSPPAGAGADDRAVNGPLVDPSNACKATDLSDTTVSSNGADDTGAKTAADPSGTSTAADIGGNSTKPGSKPDSRLDSKTADDMPLLNAANTQQTNMPASLPVLILPLAAPAPTPASANGSDDQDAGADASGSGTAAAVAQMAALSEALRAAAPRGKPDCTGGPPGADAGSSSGATDGTQSPADLQAKSNAPSLLSDPPQPAGADVTQSRNQNAASATAAAADHVRALAAIGQSTDGKAALQNDPSANSNSTAPDPDSGASASAQHGESIGRPAFKASDRRIDTFPESGDAQAGSGQAAGTSPLPGGANAAATPALLTTSSFQAPAPTTGGSQTTVPIAGLAVEIVSQFNAGSNRFDIRLDPPELGRINVRLDVDRDGKVTSRLVADRPETLDILQRNAPELERSLQQSGLKTADNGLQFSLRDQGGFNAFTGQNPYPQNGSPSNTTRVIAPDRDLPPVDGLKGYGRLSGAGTGIDIRV